MKITEIYIDNGKTVNKKEQTIFTMSEFLYRKDGKSGEFSFDSVVITKDEVKVYFFKED